MSYKTFAALIALLIAMVAAVATARYYITEYSTVDAVIQQKAHKGDAYSFVLDTPFGTYEHRVDVHTYHRFDVRQKYYVECGRQPSNHVLTCREPS